MFNFLTRCAASWLFGILTSSTPSLNTARALSVMISTGNWQVLVKEP